MKKLFSITLAAVCALSCAALSFTACGNGTESSDHISSDNSGENNPNVSDIVTNEEWLAIMTAENYNFTFDFDLTILIYDTTSGELSSTTDNYGTVYCDLTTDEDKNIIGTVHELFTADGESMMHYDYYLIYEKDYVTLYEKYTFTDGNSQSAEDTEWTTVTVYDKFERNDSYEELLTGAIAQLYIANYIGIYSLDTEDYFKYSEELGAYILTYNETDESHSTDYIYTVKINDGNISSFGAASYVTTTDGTKSSESDGIYTYYDYGTTTVTIPDDVTALFE